jgi:hypothetical protein
MGTSVYLVNGHLTVHCFMTNEEALDACARLQLKMENRLHSMFELKEKLSEAEEEVLLAKKNWIMSGKTPESEIVLLDAQILLNQLNRIKDRCDQIIRCTDGTLDLMEMHFPGINCDCKRRYEQLIMEANGTIDGMVYEAIVCPGVTQVLGN